MNRNLGLVLALMMPVVALARQAEETLGVGVGAGAGAGVERSENPTIAHRVAADGSLSTLASALESSGLAAVLGAAGPYTLLAPDDRAFARLDRAFTASLLMPENRSALHAVLMHHIIPGRLSAAELAGRATVRTLNGQMLDLAPVGVTLSVDGADLMRADLGCANGVVHVIDAVLFPVTEGMPGFLSKQKDLSAFASFVDTSGLDDLLGSGAPFTVLAPTDEAIKTLDRGMQRDLRHARNRGAVEALVKGHLVAGSMDLGAMVEAGSVRTLSGATLRVWRDGAVVRIGEGSKAARVVRGDADCAGGVVHKIDRLLVSPAELNLIPDGRLVVGIHIGARIGPVLASQLSINPREAFLVERLTRGGSAERSGLKVNDIVVALDGLPGTRDNLDIAKDRKGYGGVIEFEVIRGGQRLVIPVTVGVER